MLGHLTSKHKVMAWIPVGRLIVFVVRCSGHVEYYSICFASWSSVKFFISYMNCCYNAQLAGYNYSNFTLNNKVHPRTHCEPLVSA